MPNILYKPSKRPKAPKTKSESAILWEQFTQMAYDKGFTKKVPGTMSYSNEKGKLIKLVSTIGGIISYVDETQNNKVFQVYRKAI